MWKCGGSKEYYVVWTWLNVQCPFDGYYWVSTGKHILNSGNSGYFQDGRTLVFKLPGFKSPGGFCCQTSFKLPYLGTSNFKHRSNFPTQESTTFSTAQTSWSWGQHLCPNFAEIPHMGQARMIKVPTSSGAPFPRLGHNIDSCIIITYGWWKCRLLT